VDLCELALNKPAEERLSTRIIVVNYPDASGSPHLLGLIAEQATTVLKKETGDFKDPRVRVGAAPYLGPVLVDGQEVIQWIHEQRLLPESVRDLLFSDVAHRNHEAP
jgi:chemotaxis-related protein WspB